MRFIIPLLCLIISSCSGVSSMSEESVTNLNKSFDNWTIDDNSSSISYALAEGDSIKNDNFLWEKLANIDSEVVYDFCYAKTTQLTEKHLKNVKEQANYLLSHKDIKLLLVGYADGLGSKEYNIALGWNRAQAVKSYFEDYGVLPQQIVVLSYGKDKNLLSGRSASSLAKNRRVESYYIRG